MALLSSITVFKKTYKKQQILLFLILFVYFGVYLFIEIMPRYAYPLQIYEAILSTITLGYILEKKQKKVGKDNGQNRG